MRLEGASAEAPAFVMSMSGITLCTGFARYHAGMAERLLGRECFYSAKRPSKGTLCRSTRDGKEPDVAYRRNPARGCQWMDNLPMNKRKILAALAALIGIPFAVIVVQAWQEGAPGRERARIEQRLEGIEAGIRKENADMVRARADCVADATEFPDDPRIQGICWEGYKTIKESSDALVRMLQADRAKLQERLNALQ